jgi:hypothetical protein
MKGSAATVARTDHVRDVSGRGSRFHKFDGAESESCRSFQIRKVWPTRRGFERTARRYGQDADRINGAYVIASTEKPTRAGLTAL